MYVCMPFGVQDIKFIFFILKKNLSNLSNGGMLNGGFLSDDSGRVTPQTRNSANNTLTVPGQQQIRQSIIETSFIQ